MIRRSPRPARRTTRSRHARRLIRAARRSADFELSLPSRLPACWRLTAVDTVPGSGSMLTLLYETRDGRGFRLHQRLRVVPLREELRITGQDARELPSRGRELYLVQGAYVSGEPIDGMHRHRTREVLTWESGEVIGELEYRIGVDAPTAEMLAIAHSMTTRRRGERATRRSRRTVGVWRRLLH